MSETQQVVSNPLREGLGATRMPEPSTVVIFGGTGDLTSRKLIPSLYEMSANRLLPASFSVIGFAMDDLNDDGFRERLRRAMAGYHGAYRFEQDLWDSFAAGIFYVPGRFDDIGAFGRLKAKLAEVEQLRGTGGNRIFYLATQPSFFPVIVGSIGASGLSGNPATIPATTREANGADGAAIVAPGGAIPLVLDGHGPWTRVIIEKPFGHDLTSARLLNKQVLSVFDESQVYRIDHYLGKETVQNILALRFANGIFEPVWDRKYVDHVQIAVSEALGVEHRGRYYEEAGAIRDMVQNHMMQLLCLVTMEPPAAFSADAVRDEKVKVLRSIRGIPPSLALEKTVRGQYAPGATGDGWVSGYREEPDVSPNSHTETFVALRLEVENWRWAGVPFYLRHGKRLPKRVTEITIQFRRVPHLLFASEGQGEPDPNVLSIRIQPDEGISLRFGAKVPGPAMNLRAVHMDFLYGSAFGSAQREAYERLLLDCMLGDSTLFTRGDEVEASWRIISPIIQGWKEAPPVELPTYPAGTWGPQEARDLIDRDGRGWRRWARL